MRKRTQMVNLVCGGVAIVLNLHASNPPVFCLPDEPCWPTGGEIKSFNKQLKGRIFVPKDELSSCVKDKSNKSCERFLRTLHNPFALQNNASGTESLGWLNAWENKPSSYVVEAMDTQDVVAAVNFARSHRMRVVIKGTGHDYLGRSNGAHSLLIWTHQMRQVSYTEHFMPLGCNKKDYGDTSALTVAAGTRWLEAYNAAVNQHNRYVQGGGCTSVGAAGGFTQGGGFGSFSKAYGTGAANVLQVEIVTAEGKVLIANQCLNQDLFWAVRGGGASTFGVVTKMVLKTHPLPSHFGMLSGLIKAKNDEAFKQLITKILLTYKTSLNNPHWGEQIAFNTDNTVKLALVFSDLSEQQVEEALHPLKIWLKKHEADYLSQDNIILIPANKLWNYDFMHQFYPKMVTLNKQHLSAKQYWWASNTNETSMFWYSIQSWWLPLSLFADSSIDQLTNAIFKASRLKSITLHFNKGLSGATNEVAAAVKTTSMNPAVLDAAALIIIYAGESQAYSIANGLQPNYDQGKQEAKNVTAAMAYFRRLAPNAGTYINEADYFQEGWQRAFWGDNYKKLLAIKKKYDPKGVFYCHHCVGS